MSSKICETREISATKRKLLTACVKLMRAKGYTATTVDQICEEAHLTKGSFFHYFDDKEAIGKEALEYYSSLQSLALDAAHLDTIEDALDRLEAYLDTFLVLSRNPRVKQSCLLGNFAQELALTRPDMRALCDAHFARGSAFLVRCLEQAKKTHRPKINFDSKSLAEHFVSVIQGSLVLNKARGDATVIKDNVEHFRQYLRFLFGIGGTVRRKIEPLKE